MCDQFSVRTQGMLLDALFENPAALMKFGLVAPPFDHLRNRSWPRFGHCPRFPLYQLFEQLLQLLDLLTSCVPACVR